MINYTFSQIAAFLAVVDTRSFRLASERLHLTQSAVSTRVIELEKQLGVKLFHRTTRSVTPTKYGEQFADIAGRALGQLQEGAESLHREAKLEQGRLVISSMLSVAETFLPSLMREFKNRYPAVQIELRDVIGDTIVELILAGRADFAIFTEVTDQDDLLFEPLFQDDLYLIVNADHPLANRKQVRLSEAAEFDFVGPVRGMGLRRIIDNGFAEAGLAFAPKQEVASVSTMLRLVEAGFGSALIPEIFLPRVDLARCRKLRLRGREISRTLGIITSKGKALSPSAHAFADLLRRRARHDLSIN